MKEFNRKYRVVETAEVKRVYDIIAKNKDEAIDKIYSGEIEPSLVEDELSKVDIEETESCNKYGVPVHIYKITLKNRQTIYIDVSNEENWTNILELKDIIIWNEENINTEIEVICVQDTEDGSIWNGRSAIRDWYKNRVECYKDNYSC